MKEIGTLLVINENYQVKKIHKYKDLDHDKLLDRGTSMGVVRFFLET